MLRGVTRQERIRVLLLHLADCRAGLWDARADGGGLPLMCSVWRHPSYQRLERLLPELRRAEPRAWKALHATYEQPQFRRRAVCPRCDGVERPEHVGRTHRHGRKVVTLAPRMVRQYPVAQADVERGVAWLDSAWGSGGAFVPEELRNVTAVACRSRTDPRL